MSEPLNVTITLRGVEKAKKQLAAFPEKVAKKALRKGVRAGAKVVARAMKAGVPRVTGRTRQAIKVRAGKRTRKPVVVARAVVGAGWFKGPTFYAAFVEFGTKRIEARHHMERAGTAASQQAADAMMDATIKASDELAATLK